MTLTFYDNSLFNIECDGSEVVKRTFSMVYGEGAVQPLDTIRLCTADKPMIMKREVWHHERVVAMFIRAEGYTAACQPASVQKLVIVDQRVLALTSECDLKDGYLLLVSTR